jgi:hypothetical protein
VGVEIAGAGLDSLLDPFSRCLDAESPLRVTEFRVDQGVQARVHHLAERANDGALSEDELNEYESHINAADLISILKLKAGLLLKADDD